MSRRALVIGIDSYGHAPLSCACHDAYEFAELIAIEEYGFDCDLLVDHEATRAAIRRSLSQLLAPGVSTAIVFFAGHGCVRDETTYLQTFDTQPYDEGVSLDEVGQILFGSRDNECRVLLVLDCCHAGAASIRSGNHGLTRTLRKDDITSAAQRFGPNCAIMAACEATGFAEEDFDLQHGVFTAALLNGMLGHAANQKGEITVLSLYEFVVSRFLETGISQTPAFKGDFEGNFVLAIGLTPGDASPKQRASTDADLTRFEEELAEYNVLYSRRVQEYISFPERGYIECATRLSFVKDRVDRMRVLDLQEPQNLRLRNLQAHVISALRTLGSPLVGYRTKVGTLVEKLGSGTFGTVWKVEDEQGHRHAYKIYHSGEVDDEKKLQRFIRGYKAMELLDHDFIVRVRTFTECPYGILMDYIEGPSLRTLSDAHDGPAEKLILLSTIAETLVHAHGRQVTHRDLKPENIVLSYSQGNGRWVPNLTDFDLSWYSTATAVTQDSGALGTMQYGAPEQLRRPDSASARHPSVDVYSFAMLIYYMFVNSDPQPLAFDSNRESMRLALSRSNVMLKQSSADKLMKVYESCAREKPEHRPSGLREVIDRLQEILDDVYDQDDKKTLSWGDFCREFGYKFAGLANSSDSDVSTLKTASRQTEIGLSHELRSPTEQKVTLRLYCVHPPFMEGQQNKSVMQIMNKRIEEFISVFPDCRLRRGSAPPFEAFIDIKIGALTFETLRLVRKIAGRAVDAIEFK